jgi:hypothetical protein
MTPKEEVEKMARDHIPLSEIWLVPFALAVARYAEKRALEQAADTAHVYATGAGYAIRTLRSEYE